MMPSPTADILLGIAASKARIDAAMVEMHETVIVSRTSIELTRAWLRELERRFPVR